MAEHFLNPQYKSLKTQIGNLLQQGREQAGRAVNKVLVKTYWQIGRHIVEFEQDGKQKAAYGSELLSNLSKDLSLEYGKGFSKSNLFQIRQFYLAYPKIQTLSGQLTWSHYIEILKADNELEKGFYLKQAEKENWSFQIHTQNTNSNPKLFLTSYL